MAEQETITVSEYIAEQERLEQEARELFPKKFDMCSNSAGYVRQTVYSCLTCNPNPSEEAGFCYSCSISCHGDHNLVELFTKRAFRCDCGTKKFKNVKCTLDTKPAGAVNELNQYNHNFLGRFCWCDVQYDPHKEENTMLQCVICEDWFHDNCIGITPHGDDFDDFICRTCTRDHPFIKRYVHHPSFMIGLSEKGGGPKSVVMVDSSKAPGNTKVTLIKEGVKTESSNSLVDVVSTVEDKTAVTMTTATTSTSVTDSTMITKSSTTTVVTTTDSVAESQEEKLAQGKRSLEPATNRSSDETEDSNKRIKLDAETKSDSAICKLDQQPTDPYPDQEVNLFATEGWRDLLCQCTSCMTMYTEEGVASFILGEEAVYEAEDDDEAESSTLESGMKKLGEMDRVQMMDGMIAYNRMRDEVRAFLEPYSQQGKVVTESDIHAFFAAKMEQRKNNF
ncbi:putative zinc finger in N-recognin-domain-containing protein [Linnemannia elongata]|nr:putative zinc finger in N-recognin-domain-containing protein [Linnemannia elongata]